ncbi:DUF4097 family beta strand repeat-containing protein [Priestia taiwanensis]|uniref:DUF4097 domain-containing protein n=1 Tax=Priestia taiwanensis TaxID=1347902 RepID=A0A917AXQ1_9BACI|nr:DUF4097 family beta strand repeat-containing protein [Priestia taiwanensis]MBM7364517.1 hypothetical protein [Priestia taiwanensis]GGE80891.1 hypothetical protein GCM10007140_33020 [Priestia taiwanensis]
MSKGLKLFAVLLIVIGLVGAFFTFSPYYKSIAVSDAKTISADNITDIEVDLRFGEVVIIPTTSKDILIEIKGKVSNGTKSIPVIAEKGKIIEVKSESPFQFFQLGFFNPELKVTLHVPKKQYEQIRVKTELGDIDIEQLQVNTVEAATKLGDVDMQDVKSTSVVAKSDLGKIELAQVEGDINASTKLGDVDIAVHEFAYPINAHTDLGDVDIKTKVEPKNVRFDVSSELGKVKVFNQSGSSFVYGQGSIVIKGFSELGDVTVSK